MTKLTQKLEVEIEATPEQIADLFWEMDNEQQGRFFTTLSRINSIDFENQMWYARKHTSEEGRQTLKIMAGVK